MNALLGIILDAFGNASDSVQGYILLGTLIGAVICYYLGKYLIDSYDYIGIGIPFYILSFILIAVSFVFFMGLIFS